MIYWQTPSIVRPTAELLVSLLQFVPKSALQNHDVSWTFQFSKTNSQCCTLDSLVRQWHPVHFRYHPFCYSVLHFFFLPFLPSPDSTRGLRTAVSSPSGSKAEPRPQTHLWDILSEGNVFACNSIVSFVMLHGSVFAMWHTSCRTRSGSAFLSWPKSCWYGRNTDPLRARYWPTYSERANASQYSNISDIMLCTDCLLITSSVIFSLCFYFTVVLVLFYSNRF